MSLRLRPSRRCRRRRHVAASEQLEPRQLLAGDLVSHWWADQLDGTVADGDPVAEWTDQVGGATADAVGTPHLVKDALDGHSVVRFNRADGVDSLVVPAVDNALAGAVDFSIAVAFATNATTLNGGTTAWFLNTGLVDATDFFGTTADWGLVLNGNAQVGGGLGGPGQTVYSQTGGLNDGQAHAAVYTVSGGTQSLTVDLAEPDVRSGGSTLPRIANDITFGAVSRDQFALNGDIAEVRFYDGALSAAEVDALVVELLTLYTHVPPQANHDAYTVAEDGRLSVDAAAGLLANDRTVEPETLIAKLVDAPAHGILTLNDDGSFTYLPDPNYFGADSFTYLADNTAESQLATVSLTVDPLYDPPVAVADTYLTAANLLLSIDAANGVLLNDPNPDQGPLTAMLVEDVEHGTLTLATDGSFDYQPVVDFTGTDRFRYHVTDGTTLSQTVDVDLLVDPNSVSINEFMAVNGSTLLTRVRLTAADSFAAQISPAWIELRNLASTPFDVGGMYLTDNAAGPQRWQIPAGTFIPARGYLVVYASGLDIVDPALDVTERLHTSFELEGDEDSVGLVGADGTVISELLPIPVQFEDVSFGRSRYAGQLGYLTIPTPGEANPIAVQEIAVADSYLLDASGSQSVLPDSGVLANDWNANRLPLEAVLVEDVDAGLLQLSSDGSFAYDPAGFSGTTTFRYLVRNALGDQNTVDVTLLVDHPPGAVDDRYQATEDEPLVVPVATGLLSNDTDFESDSLTAELVNGPQHGSVTLLEDGSLTYQPEPDFSGNDVFTYRSRDADQRSSPARVEIEVASVDDSPEAVADSYFVRPDAALEIVVSEGVLANDINADRLPLSASLVTGPAHGTLELRPDGSLTYLPEAGYTGADSFDYRIATASVGLDTATVTLNVFAAPIEISELMAINGEVLVTQVRATTDAEYTGGEITPDWFELRNLTAVPLNVGGSYLSDNLDNPRQWQIPAGTTIPAEGYLVLFASGLDVRSPALDQLGYLHTGFKLAGGGESLSLSGADGNLLAESAYPLQFEDVSFGVSPAGGDVGFWTTPTPGAANSGNVVPLAPITDVQHIAVAAVPEGNGPLVVRATLEETGPAIASVSLHYRVMYEEEQTLVMADDGQGPDAVAGDGVYTATIPAGVAQPGEMLRYYVTAADAVGTQFREPAFLDRVGIGQSPEYFGTVVEDPAIVTDLPVLHRFVENVRGPESDPGTRASLYYNGEFYDNVYIRIRGGTARAWPKKSYKIEFNDNHLFLRDPVYPRVDEININTTYTDKSYLRAVLADATHRESGGPSPIQFHVRMQQNGEFFSVALMVEQPDEDYLIRNGFNPDGLLYKGAAGDGRLFTPNGIGSLEKKTRDHEDHRELFALIDGLQPTGEPLEDFLFDNIDIPAQVNYLASVILTQNIDASDKNYYIYKDVDGNNEWLMMPWDIDLSFGPDGLNVDCIIADESGRDCNLTTPGFNAPGNPLAVHPFLGSRQFTLGGLNGGKFNLLEDRIFTNPRTQEMFLRRLRTMTDELLGTTYYQDRIDELVAQLDPDVALDRARWTTSAHFGGTGLPLQTETDRIKQEYLAPRLQYLTDFHVNMGVGIPLAQTASPGLEIGAVEFDPAPGNADEEYVEVINPNGTSVDLSGWRLSGAGIEHTFAAGTVLEAGGRIYVSPNVPAFRARTVGPSGNQGLFVQGSYTGRLANSGGRLQVSDRAGAMVAEQTYQGTDPSLAESLRISELHYHPADTTAAELAAGYSDADDFEFVELVNIGSQPIDLSSAQLVQVDVGGNQQGVAFDFSQSVVTSLGPGERVVVVENLNAFTFRYGEGLPVAGQWSGGLSNNSELLTLVGDGETIHSFAYDDAWHPTTDGEGPSLELIDAQHADLASWGQAASWQPSAAAGGTPGSGELGTRGDFTGDGAVTVSDIDRLSAEIRSPAPGLGFDLTGDGLVDQLDLSELVEGVLGRQFGDANLDGAVTAAEDGQTLLANLGEPGPLGWSDADFDADGLVTASGDGALLLSQLATDVALTEAELWDPLTKRGSTWK